MDGRQAGNQAGAGRFSMVRSFYVPSEPGPFWPEDRRKNFYLSYRLFSHLSLSLITHPLPSPLLLPCSSSPPSSSSRYSRKSLCFSTRTYRKKTPTNNREPPDCCKAKPSIPLPSPHLISRQQPTNGVHYPVAAQLVEEPVLQGMHNITP